MRNINKTLLIVGIICVIVVIFCLGKYFHKYYVITKFQQKLNEIVNSRNYIYKEYSFTKYIKDDIIVTEHSNKEYYFVDNLKSDKDYEISKEEGIRETTAVIFEYMINNFFIKDINEDTTIWNIIKNISYAELTTENIKGVECYRLFCLGKYNTNGLFLYFNKKTYMPVAYEYDGQINYVEVTVGTVTDEDISVDKIYEKVMELPN